jgi:ATP-binding cassette subfamily B protein
MTPVDSSQGAPQAPAGTTKARSAMRKLAPMVTRHKLIILASLAWSIGALFLQVELPQVLGANVIDHALLPALRSNGADRSLAEHRLLASVGALVALGVAASVMTALSRRTMAEAAYRVEGELRKAVFEAFHQLPARFFDQVQVGQLASRADSDLQAIQQFLLLGPQIVVRCLVALVALGFMLALSPLLALASMATMPFVYFTSARLRRALRPLSWLIQMRLADVATVVDESVSGAQVVRALAAEDRQISALAEAAGRLRWAYVRDADTRATWAPVVQNVAQVGLAMVLVVGAWLVAHHHLQVGALITFTFWIGMVQAPFQMLGMLFVMSQRASVSAERVAELLDSPKDADPPEAIELVRSRCSVAFEAVSFAYPASAKWVLDGFDLAVEPGEAVAIVGKSGAGKTTVGRLLVRFYQPQEGRILLDGLDLRSLSGRSLRESVGFVGDDAYIFSASLFDNLAFARPEADRAEVFAAAAACGVDEFAQRLPQGYETLLGEQGLSLSGGQRQRVALARALLADPPVLFLDDATSALDAETERAVLLHALGSLTGRRTLLIVASKLSTALLASRVVMVHDGRVVADGKHDKLLVSCPLYKDLAQNRVAPTAGQGQI